MGSQASDDSSSYSADFVAKSFVERYYTILHRAPQHAHHFYQDCSVFGRPGPDGVMTSVTTMQGIGDKIMSLDYKDSLATILTVYAQGSLMGGVIAGVTGYLTGSDNVERNFYQTFFLAPQEKGYYVLNDFLHFTDQHNSSTPLPVDNVDENTTSAPPLTQEKAHVVNLPAKNQIPTPIEATVKVLDESNLKNSSVEEVSISELSANKSQNDGVPATTDLASNAQDAPKMSYASMLAKASMVMTPVHVPVSSTVSVSPKANQQPRATAGPNSSQQLPRASAAPNPSQQPTHASVAPNPSRQPPCSSPASNPSQQQSSVPAVTAPTSDGVPRNSNGCAEVKGIYIGGLPTDITYSRLEAVVKKFGPVKQDGIQIRRYEDGFSFGFVEFESLKSAHDAVEAHTIAFGKKEAYIDFKRSNMQGGNNRGRGRFQSGGGGYRNENFRSRESYGEGCRFGNGNGRNDYVNRYVSGEAPPGGPRGEAPPRWVGRNWEANGRVYQNGAGGRAPCVD
ncbi:hypothetical protein LguiA_000445 [Lonicera macranthoides]